jgi:hypothetical protein
LARSAPILKAFTTLKIAPSGLALYLNPLFPDEPLSPDGAVRWLSPGDFLAIAISAADGKARLYKRQAGALSTLLESATALRWNVFEERNGSNPPRPIRLGPG